MTLTLPTIKFLKQPTSEAWIEQAIAHLDTILLDHSHCERKAAGVALNLMFRYPAREKLVRMLTAIAREELEHFEQVNQRLEQRNIALLLCRASLRCRFVRPNSQAGTGETFGFFVGFWFDRSAQSRTVGVAGRSLSRRPIG